MTLEEFRKIPVRETCHLALEDEYTTTYASRDNRFAVCVHVPRHPHLHRGNRRRQHHLRYEGQ